MDGPTHAKICFDPRSLKTCCVAVYGNLTRQHRLVGQLAAFNRQQRDLQILLPLEYPWCNTHAMEKQQ